MCQVFYTTESLQSKGWTDMLTAHRAIFGSGESGRLIRTSLLLASAVHTGKAAAVADPAVEQANAESVAGLGAVDSIGSASLIDVLRTKNHPVYLSPVGAIVFGAVAALMCGIQGMDGTGDMNQQAEKYFQLYLFKLTNSLVSCATSIAHRAYIINTNTATSSTTSPTSLIVTLFRFET